MRKVYHNDIGIPDELRDAAIELVCRYYGTFRLEPHAKDRMKEKGVEVPKHIPFRNVELIEVTILGKQVEKILIRFPSPTDPLNDVVMSLTSTGFVKTVWYNAKTDKHRTLDKSKYAKPE